MARNGGLRQSNLPPEVPGYHDKTDTEMATIFATELGKLTGGYDLIDDERDGMN